MGLKPIKSWDSEPKGWLEEPTPNVDPATDETTPVEPETQTSEFTSWDLTPSPEDLVEEATESVGTVATEDPVIGVDLAQAASITETLEDAASNPINSEPAMLAVSEPANDAVEEDRDVLDLTFRIMQLYNLPYDLSRAFEMACSADHEDRTTAYAHIVKLLKHRLGSVDAYNPLTEAAIPMEDSADWIIDVLGLDFVYGKCVDSILTYAQTGKVSMLDSAIRTLEYQITIRKYDEPL